MTERMIADRSSIEGVEEVIRVARAIMRGAIIISPWGEGLEPRKEITP